MEIFLILLFAALVGLSHAFETDHLLAVSNLVSKHNNTKLAIKDGIFWGLGHTTTILLVGIVVMVGKITIFNDILNHFEVIIAFLLIILGVYRLRHLAPHLTKNAAHSHKHHVAYGVGLIHGLAGSGALILLVMTELKSNWLSFLYLLIFGAGSIVGMLLVAVFLSLPFYRKYKFTERFQHLFIITSSVLCIGYGFWLLYAVSTGNLHTHTHHLYPHF